MKNVKKGFTLVEILVVIVIIGILLVALLPRVSAALNKAKETELKTDFRAFSTAAESVLREYSGFANVPLMAQDDTVIATITEKFYGTSTALAEGTDTPVTVSLIQAMNRYLESNFAFGALKADGTIAADFGKSAKQDPWGQAYEVYFVSRAYTTGLDSDRIYVTSNGKTKNKFLPDYTLLCQYQNGEVRTAQVGFDGESYDKDMAYTKVDKKYVCLNNLFNATSADTCVAEKGTTKAADATTSIFSMGQTGAQARLFVSAAGQIQGTAGLAASVPQATK